MPQLVQKTMVGVGGRCCLLASVKPSWSIACGGLLGLQQASSASRYGLARWPHVSPAHLRPAKMGTPLLVLPGGTFANYGIGDTLKRHVSRGLAASGKWFQNGLVFEFSSLIFTDLSVLRHGLNEYIK